MSRWTWIALSLLAVIIAAVVIERIVHDNKKNALISEQATLINHYQNAKVQIDTVHDTIYRPGRVVIKPVPVSTVIRDTVRIVQRQSWYDSLFRKGDIKFRWMACGNLDYIAFSDFTWPKEVITVTRMVDTCVIDYRPPIIRIGPYVDMSLNSFQKFPGLGLGVQAVIKDQFTASVGVLYLGGVYGNIRLGWLFVK